MGDPGTDNRNGGGISDGGGILGVDVAATWGDQATEVTWCVEGSSGILKA